jgi:hypothetical protein
MKRSWMTVRAASVLLVLAGGCSMIAGLNNEYEQEGASPSGGGGGGFSCMLREDCPPDTECVTWACSDGACIVSIAADGTPRDIGEVVGDCKKNVCQAGKPATLPDDTDLVEDNNPCTVEMCNGGVKQAASSPDGTVCGSEDKLACVGGLCIGCNQDPTACDPPGACQTIECPVDTCLLQPKPAGTKAGDNDTPGDCRSIVCDEGGGLSEGVDDTDVPTDMSAGDCSVPGCLNGMIISTTKPSGDFCTAETNGKCCGTNCCANAMGSVPNYCDKDNMCCPSNKTCNGVCCMNTTASCINNACCETSSVCNNVCCPTSHPCDNTGSCCPAASQCPDGTCCPNGQMCKANNTCL